MDSTALLIEIHRLHAGEHDDRALDVLFHWVDDDLDEGGVQSDALLKDVDVSLLNEDLIVGLLVITYTGRHLLPSRPAFVDRAQVVLTQQIGPEDAATLLQGLRW